MAVSRRDHKINVPDATWAELEKRSGKRGAKTLIEQLCEEFLSSEHEKEAEAARNKHPFTVKI